MEIDSWTIAGFLLALLLGGLSLLAWIMPDRWLKVCREWPTFGLAIRMSDEFFMVLGRVVYPATALALVVHLLRGFP